MTARLSALVVVRNEEAQLGACLDALAFADELVVVLDRCTDGSAAVAAAAGAKPVAGAWEQEGARRNAGIAACSGDWVLEVDADERVTPELAREIRQRIAGAPFGHFLVPVDNYVGATLVRHGWGGAWGTGAVARLFAAGPDGPAKRWGAGRVHPPVTLRGARMRLDAPLVHLVDDGISDMLRRLDRYTAARAQDLRESGELGTLPANLRRMLTRFWKCYVGRRGYREGGWGVVIALMAGLYPLLSHLRARLEPGPPRPGGDRQCG